MINKIKAFFGEINAMAKVKLNDINTLNELYVLLQSEYKIKTHKEICELDRSEIKHYDYIDEDSSFHIYKTIGSNKKKVIKLILESFPKARIKKSGDLVIIVYSSNQYRNKITSSKTCPIQNKVLPNIKEILDKLEYSTSNSFQFLLDKYESTFLLLQSTILEIKEESEIDQESKSKIVDILNTFIDEYNSMEAVFEKRSAAYKEDIKNSINQRLQDELKFVSDRKTSWDIIEIEPKYESGLDLINKL